MIKHFPCSVNAAVTLPYLDSPQLGRRSQARQAAPYVIPNSYISVTLRLPVPPPHMLHVPTTCMSYETCMQCDVDLPTDTCLMCLVLKGVEGRSRCCFGANLSPWTGARTAPSLCSGSDMWKKERKPGAEPFTEDRSAVKTSQSEEVTLDRKSKIDSQ